MDELQGQRCRGGSEAGPPGVQRREPRENRKSQGRRVWASLDVWLQHEEAITHPPSGERSPSSPPSLHLHQPLLNTYCVPSADLSTLHVLFHAISQHLSEEGLTVIPMFIAGT